MLGVNQLVGFGAGGTPVELVYSASNIANEDGAAIPTVSNGDLIVAVELSTATAPVTEIVPSGWTSVFFQSTDTGPGSDVTLACATKVANGGETGKVFLTDDTTPIRSTVIVFSGNASALGSIVDANVEATAGDPADQVVNASTLGLAPKLIVAAYTSTSGVTTRTFSGDTEDGEVANSTIVYVKHLFYGASAAASDITVGKIDDGADNGLGSAIIEVT